MKERLHAKDKTEAGINKCWICIGDLGSHIGRCSGFVVEDP